MSWQALNISEETHRTLYAKTKEREVSVINRFFINSIKRSLGTCKKDSCQVRIIKASVKVSSTNPKYSFSVIKSINCH